ncbi:AAA family ATPase [Polymorphospora sp. NPDC051019]|uniref:helix-turn-helix transcriptional regulator n=1 Tax=Polymorphospora sp. NPDC051019 TaxID=3155725 RepID=UPI00343C5783
MNPTPLTSPVLIGRDAELTTIAEAAGQVRLGHGRALFVTGEAGIGKSRLIRDAGRAVTGMTVLSGRATVAGTSMPFRPLVEALNTRLRVGPTPTGPELEPFRPALSRLFPEWRADGAAGSGAGESTLVLAEGVLRLLAVLGREQPLLLVLEDLHDADPETLEVLGYLTANLAGLPVLVLASLRTGPSPALDLAYRLRRDHDVPLLALSALTPAQVTQLAAQCLRTDPADLPERLADRLARNSDGVPFVVEELLAGMMASGALRQHDARWHSDDDLAGPVPVTVVRAVADRADRLGPPGRRLLEAAAVIGARFPLPVLHSMLEQTAEATDELLRTATAAHLLRPDPTDPDWYAFRHALIATALLGELPHRERSRLAATAARALAARYPDLPGELCPLAAELRLAAGDSAGAAHLLAQAGDRALAQGAANSAATLLERAHHLLRSCGDRPGSVAVLERLLTALEEIGEFDRAQGLVNAVLALPDLTTAEAIALHSRLGWMAFHGGRTADAESRIAAARMLLGPDAGAAQLAAVDVVHAHVLSLQEGRADEAERVALRAATEAERVPLPEVVCRARQLLALMARRRGFAEADRHLLEVLRVAEEHRLPLWRIRASIRLASNRMIQTGHSEQLRQARGAAWAMGAVHTGYEADASLAMHDVFYGRYDEALRGAGECAAAMVRFGKAGDLRYALAVQAAAHAHRADRAGMEAALAEFARRGGLDSYHMPIVHGLSRAFCALLEEDRPAARSELDAARAFDERRDTIYYQYGRYGLALLLDVLAGGAGRREYEEVAAHPAAALRWNRQFVHFADAVLLGATGAASPAATALARAREAAAVFPTAHRLGLRLVAEAALEHGWGDPARWLREAELHFQTIGTPWVAAACRTLIRRAGQRAPQRRTGHDLLPPRLRERGVTVREHEVLLLLAERHGNKEIARRLYLSHRTVEKHVASLLRKLDHPHRSALCDYAAAMPAPGHGEPAG